MSLVRFYDGPVAKGVILHDTQMPVVPRIGETVTLRFPDRSEHQYEVIDVDYLLELRKGIEITEDLTGARIALLRA